MGLVAGGSSTDGFFDRREPVKQLVDGDARNLDRLFGPRYDALAQEEWLLS
jgi:hypothetical protein